MAISNIRAVGGRLQSEHLKSTLDGKYYDVVKAHVWLNMLKQKTVPTKWFKPTKKGTKINFDYPQSQEQWDDSYMQLKAYISYVNEKHGTDMYIDKG